MSRQSFKTAAIAALASLTLIACSDSNTVSQSSDERDPSVARLWNEVLLEAIRNDFARPTVHARNLFHISAAMYDAWAVFDVTAETWLLGKQVSGYECPLDYVAFNRDFIAAQEEAVSFAAYRLLSHRFVNAPRRGADSGRRRCVNANTGLRHQRYVHGYSWRFCRGNGQCHCVLLHRLRITGWRQRVQ